MKSIVNLILLFVLFYSNGKTSLELLYEWTILILIVFNAGFVGVYLLKQDNKSCSNK